MKPGDIVVILDNKYCENFFNVGDKAKLINQYDDEDWLADFTINKNYVDDGIWCIGRENIHFKLFEENKMTHKEILEAILKGETLIEKGSIDSTIRLNGDFIIYQDGSKATGICLFEHYDIKQKTININGFEVPEPVKEPLNDGDDYFIANTLYEDVELFSWKGTHHDKRFLERGLIHLTKEAAQIHLDALLSFTKQN